MGKRPADLVGGLAGGEAVDDGGEGSVGGGLEVVEVLAGGRLAFQTKALIAASSSIDAMLETERVEVGPDTGWTAASRRFGPWLDELDQDSRQKQKPLEPPSVPVGPEQ
ncbi:hypothetical protein [Streptomyces sp. NPDC046182]|uniref:hypothetical protein n=1 Tax=Streptomyces sp. NPDC046182 TaxID=3154601 RepID=UPI0033C64DF3